MSRRGNGKHRLPGKGSRRSRRKIQSLRRNGPKFLRSNHQSDHGARTSKKKVDTPEIPAKTEFPAAKKAQSATSEKIAEPTSVSTKSTTPEIEKAANEQARAEVLLTALTAGKQEVQEPAPDAADTNTEIQAFAEEELRRDIIVLRADSLGRDETNDLIAWERQYDSERQTRLARVETAQLQVLPEGPDVIKASTVDKPVVPGLTARPPEITGKIPVPAVEISPATFDPAPIETEQDRVEDTAVDDLESLYLAGDFGPDNTIFEQPEETLPSDDIYAEAGIFEENDTGVDILPADLEDLEAGFRLVEAEYMSELLAGIFKDFVEVEVDVIGEQEEALDIQPSKIAAIETQEDGPDSPESAMLQGHEEEFNLYLGSLEPTRAEATKDLVAALTAAIKDSRELPSGTSQEKEIIGQELEEQCVRLFEYLGIEYDEEITRRFIQSITAPESVTNTDTYELTAEDLNNMGTREYKPLGDVSLLGGLTRFIRRKTQPRRMLGRYTVQVCSG